MKKRKRLTSKVEDTLLFWRNMEKHGHLDEWDDDFRTQHPECIEANDMTTRFADLHAGHK